MIKLNLSRVAHSILMQVNAIISWLIGCFLSLSFICMILYVTECSIPKPLPFLDSQITSGTFYSDRTARHARLGDPGGWISTAGQSSCWLMIDFLQRTTMTTITVEGSPAMNIRSSSFTIEYSNNGNTFGLFKESGSTKVSKMNI
jgi:hypothetical protein